MKKTDGRVVGVPVIRMMTYFVILLIATVIGLGLLSNKVSEEEASDRRYISSLGDEKVLAQIKSQSQSSAEVTDIRRQFEAQRISMQPTREQVAAGLLSRVLQLCQDFDRQAV